MSLIKQLWIAITLVMLLAFGGSMVVSVLSARQYLEQQLQVKNIDNATSLALSISQMPKDPVTVELQVSAQFDVGHYRYIRITSPRGAVITQRQYDGKVEGVPQWFVSLIPIRVQPGQALIQDGWKQYGTITLDSNEEYAYKSLWDGTLELLLWFVIGGVATGVFGSLAIRYITRPLTGMVAQAHAIADRRFLTTPEPRTPELRSVVRAMNDMVGRLKTMFAEEAARLESLRQKVNNDPVTGLAGREYFLSNLREILEGEQFGSVGTLVMVRLPDLNTVNAKLGRQRADALLKELGDTLKASGEGHSGQRAGRVKGGEFAVVFPTIDSPSAAAQDVLERLRRDWAPHWLPELPELFSVGAVRYQREQPLGQVLSQVDEALARAQAQGPNNWYAAEQGSSRTAVPAEQWRTLLTEAVNGGRLALVFYPVVAGTTGAALHEEGMIRLQADPASAPLSAGDFMPMAAQLNLTAPIDLNVVKLAIEHLRTSGGDVAVNLSSDILADFSFRNQITQLLKEFPDICKRLLFEVPEYGAFRQFDAFRDLARTLKQLGCRVGIEYFGQHFAESGKLADLGLDYVKVHPSYVRGIASNEGNQEFLRGLCKMAHALGIVVIALGVESANDLPLLASLGFDGATGPGVPGK